MHNKTWFLFTVISILLSAIGIAACNQAPTEPLTIAINDWTGYQPLLLAQQLGFLNQKSVHLATLGSTTETLQKFRAGLADAACVTLDEALLLKAEGYDISMVLVIDISNGADAIVAKSDIHKLDQLKGKRIGVENTALGAYVLARALDKAKLSVRDIDTIPINASEQLSAFRNKNIDAVVSFEPELSRLVEKGGHIVFDSSMIPDEIVDVLVVRNSALKKYHNSLGQAIHAWFKTLDYIHQHPENYLDWLSTEQQVDKHAVRKALSKIVFPNQDKNRALLKQDGPTEKSLRKMSQVMLDKKLILRQPNITSMTTDQFVK